MRNAFLGPLVAFTGTDDAGTLLFLPLAHVFARIIEVGCIEAGVVLGHCADLNALLPALAAFRPTFILAVPRVFEKVYNSAEQKAASERKGAIFGRAAQTAIAYSEALDSPAGPGSACGPSTRCSTGWSTPSCAPRSAAGPVTPSPAAPRSPTRLGHFFRGVGVTIYRATG